MTKSDDPIRRKLIDAIGSFRRQMFGGTASYLPSDSLLADDILGTFAIAEKTDEAMALAAYKARFAHDAPRNITPWEELPDDVKAIWERVAAAVALARAFPDAQGIIWFERTFGVPLGDKPGQQDAEAVRARAGMPSLDELGGGPR